MNCPFITEEGNQL